MRGSLQVHESCTRSEPLFCVPDIRDAGWIKLDFGNYTGTDSFLLYCEFWGSEAAW